LSRRPHLSAVSNLSSTISHRGRAHDCAFSSHVRAPAPLLTPAPCSPTFPLSFAPSAQLPRPLSCSACANQELRHRPPPVLWPPLRPCPVQCHGELRLAVSYSGHPSVCPLPPNCARSTLTGAFSCAAGVCHRRPVEPLRLRRCFATPALQLEVSNLLVPLIWLSLLCSSHDCSPEQSSAVVSPLRRGLRSLVPPRRREGHGRVSQTPLIAPRLVPEPLVPCRGRSAHLRRTLTVEPSGATAFWSGPQPLDLEHSSEIERFRFHLCGSDRSPSIWIRSLSPLPLPRVSTSGPGWSVHPNPLTPWPRLSAASVRPRPRDLIWAVDL
jgi:hypothetical protein